MVRRAVALLNDYYFARMQGSDETSLDLIQLIELLGGLFGLYPSLRPVFSDAKRAQLLFALQQYERVTERPRGEYLALPVPGEDKYRQFITRAGVPQSFRDAHFNRRPPAPGEAWELKKYLAASMFAFEVPKHLEYRFPDEEQLRAYPWAKFDRTWVWVEDDSFDYKEWKYVKLEDIPRCVSSTQRYAGLETLCPGRGHAPE